MKKTQVVNTAADREGENASWSGEAETAGSDWGKIEDSGVQCTMVVIVMEEASRNFKTFLAKPM